MFGLDEFLDHFDRVRQHAIHRVFGVVSGSSRNVSLEIIDQLQIGRPQKRSRRHVVRRCHQASKLSRATTAQD